MSEAAMWTAIRPVLVGLDPVRVENPVGPGTPDVNYVHGWIELKWVDRWPPREGPLRIDHYTSHQRSWHIRRSAAGGRVFVLLKVGNHEWLLFSGLVAARCLGQSTREELYKVSIARWTRLPKKEELREWLVPK